MAVSRLGLIKFLELAITITCLGLLYKTQNTSHFYTDVVTGTAFGGYFIILIGGFAGHMLSSPINKKIDIFFCLAGCAIFIAAGSLNVQRYENTSGEIRNLGLAKASMAIINGVIFLADAFFTSRGDY